MFIVRIGDKDYSCPDVETLKLWHAQKRVMPGNEVYMKKLGKWVRLEEVIPVDTAMAQNQQINNWINNWTGYSSLSTYDIKVLKGVVLFFLLLLVAIFLKALPLFGLVIYLALTLVSALLCFHPAKVNVINRSQLLSKLYSKQSVGIILSVVFFGLSISSFSSWYSSGSANRQDIKNNNAIFQKATSHIESEEYQKAIDLLGTVSGNPRTIEQRNELSKKASEGLANKFLSQGIEFFNQGNWEYALSNFNKVTQSTSSYQQAQAYIKRTNENIREDTYSEAVILFNDEAYDEAKAVFATISDYKDSGNYLIDIDNIINEQTYGNAIALLEEKRYSEAKELFTIIPNYKDSLERCSKIEELIKADNYQEAISLYRKKKYEEARALLLTYPDYMETINYLDRIEAGINNRQYQQALNLYNRGKYQEAKTIFMALSGYKSSDTYLSRIERKLLASRVEKLSFARLDKNPDRWKGTFVRFRGQVFNIEEGGGSTVMQVNVTHLGYGIWNDQIMVFYGGYTDAVKDDIITFYGTVSGSYSYTTVAGWTMTVPLVQAEAVFMK
ncbi:MAG: hypothetical protein P9M14_00645 [Candidatus Alcyoniella australis]|nr:hypothetical protein [Candidatus Alcyoniella australis]